MLMMRYTLIDSVRCVSQRDNSIAGCGVCVREGAPTISVPFSQSPGRIVKSQAGLDFIYVAGHYCLIVVDVLLKASGITPRSSELSSFFFFQAEDGIRDLIVTGVQTCALPIYGERGHVQDPHRGRPVVGLLRGRVAGGALRAHGGDYVRGTEDPDPLAPRRRAAQIGRASCRERV